MAYVTNEARQDLLDGVADAIEEIGAALGALGGALASPTTSLVPGVGAEMMVLSFAVYLAPELEVLTPYLIMVVVLLVRPQGLFGKAGLMS